jgi:hypothetical protein
VVPCQCLRGASARRGPRVLDRPARTVTVPVTPGSFLDHGPGQGRAAASRDPCLQARPGQARSSTHQRDLPVQVLGRLRGRAMRELNRR